MFHPGDARAVDPQGLAAADLAGARRGAWFRLVVHVRVEAARLACLRPVVDVRRVELVEMQRERRERRRRRESPVVPVVIRADNVGEALTLDNKTSGLVSGKTTQSDAGEQQQQCQVEDEVAALAEVSLLRSQPTWMAVHAEPLATKSRGKGV